jgi:hypothetical protein
MLKIGKRYVAIDGEGQQFDGWYNGVNDEGDVILLWNKDNTLDFDTFNIEYNKFYKYFKPIKLKQVNI